jgi:PRTRC genetic system protein A
MIELVPHMSCVVMEQEFEQALQGNHQEIYVITSKGVMKHVKLKAGRHVRFQVDSIPGATEKDVLKEEINFLPNGKIPTHLLEEIVQFFKDVMSIKKADQEAMAHILWNEADKDSPDRGYRIGIPDQVVSKASAEYTFNHIKKGDIIILDLHSHNTMGAFFSGTDDRDDKKGYYYAGVAGKLDEKTPTFVWRLNIGEHRKTVLMDDIFDVPEKKIAIPKEWIDKVEVKTYGGYKGPIHSGPGMGWHHDGKAWIFSSNGPKQQQQHQQHQGKKNKKHKGQQQQGGPRISESDEERAMRFLENMRDHPNLWEDLHSEGAGLEGFEGVFHGEEPSDSNIVSFNTRAPQDNKGTNSGSFYEEEIDTLGFLEEDYDEHAVNFGIETADAFEQIVEWLDDISDNDKLLLKVIGRCYERMTSDGQSKLATTGI